MKPPLQVGRIRIRGTDRDPQWITPKDIRQSLGYLMETEMVHVRDRDVRDGRRHQFRSNEQITK